EGIEAHAAVPVEAVDGLYQAARSVLHVVAELRVISRALGIERGRDGTGQGQVALDQASTCGRIARRGVALPEMKLFSGSFHADEVHPPCRIARSEAFISRATARDRHRQHADRHARSRTQRFPSSADAQHAVMKLRAPDFLVKRI